MKTSHPLLGKLSRVHINWLRIPFIIFILFVLTVFGSKKSSEVGAAIAAPQKAARNVASPSIVITPAYLIPPPDANATPPPLPEINSPENAPPSPPDLLNSATIVSGDPAAPQTHCHTWGYCWNIVNQFPSTCTVDLNKRALAMTLFFPQYGYNIPLSASQGWIWHKVWLWYAGAQQWLTTGWGPPTTQIANNVLQTNNIIFRQQQYYGLDIIGGGAGLMTTMASTSPGLSGPNWVVIERYVTLNQVDDPPLNLHSYVPFNNGSIYCGYNFPASAQSDPGTEGASSIAELAPTPPANDNPPSFSYIPLINRSGVPDGEPLPTPTPYPTTSPPPTPSSPPTIEGIVNPNFDAGPNVGWTEYSSQGYDVVMTGPKGFSARSGQYLAWLGGAHNDTSRISQMVTVPDSHPFLSLYLMATSQEDLCNYDRALIMVDESQVASIGLCKPQNFHAWLKSQIDLRDFAGQTVTLTIQVETDNSLLSSLFVDDLSFESGVFIPTPAPSPTPLPSDGTILNPGFELGDNGDWGSYSSSGANNIFLHEGAHSGNWLAWLGGLNDEVGYIDQMISIPSDKPYLTYWGWISSAESTCGGDQVWFLAGDTAVYGYNLCSAYNSTQWGQGWVNLSAYAGTTQRIRIQVQTNSTLSSSLYMDDFAFAANPPTSVVPSESGGQPSEFNALPESTGVSPSGKQIPATGPELKDNAK